MKSYRTTRSSTEGV